MLILHLFSVNFFLTCVVAHPYTSDNDTEPWYIERDLSSIEPALIEKPACGCSTVYSTIIGEGRLYSPPPTPTPLANVAQATDIDGPFNESDLPIPLVVTFQTPGIFEIPAKTITLNVSATAYAATSTGTGPGHHVVEELKTIVDELPDVIYPYADVTTTDRAEKSTDSTSTYFPSSVGTYIMGSQMTDKPDSTTGIYLLPTSYAPGVYIRPSTVITVTQTSYVFRCPYTLSEQIKAEPTEIAKPSDTSNVPNTAVDQVSAEPSGVESLDDILDRPDEADSLVIPEPADTPLQENSPESQQSPANQVKAESGAGPLDGSTPVTDSTPITYTLESAKTMDIEHPTPYVGAPSSDAPATGELKELGSIDDLWAITFSPYSDSGGCKTADTVRADVAKIKLAGFKAIRVYSPDCSGLENIGSAAEFHGLKLIIGIFVNETGCSGAALQVKQISDWGKWHLVELVVIGNEALFNGHTSAQELASFISSTKSTLRSAGYQGPCTTAEPLNMWQEHSSSLCDVVDVVGCNIHPFFNAEVNADNAGPFVKSQLDIVHRICPGKRGINLECGWPSAGECNGKACPGKNEQAIAVSGIRTYAGNMSIMFTYTNDYWKSPGLFHVEQSFGIIELLVGYQAPNVKSRK